MTTYPSLPQLILSQFVVALVLATALGISQDLQLGASAFFGAALMLFNVWILAWTSQRLFDKKSVAWTSLIIVIKYAVLLGSIYIFARTDWFRPLGAGLGVASFVVAALVLAAFYYRRDPDLAVET